MQRTSVCHSFGYP